MTATDTIAAVATPPGRGALGIVRASGPNVQALLMAVTGGLPVPRTARLCSFRDVLDQVLDSGLVLYFPAPASYTGEDMCEFHAHGNPHVLRALLQCLCHHGARPARPGEFTERAFRHGKLDLAQAEAVADLIEGNSLRAARCALRSLRGEFSRRVTQLIQTLTDARVAFEGSIDFPDELTTEVLGRQQYDRVAGLREDLTTLLARANHGARLAAGATVAIVGAPNVGKSTLLNAIAGEERAIVSSVPGTTRDLVQVDIELGGVSVRLYDTAGLRRTADEVEQEGIRRATQVMATADLVVIVTDDPEVRSLHELRVTLGEALPPAVVTMVVHNKIDRVPRPPARLVCEGVEHLFVAARDRLGLDALHDALAAALALGEAHEDEFVARTRHLDAIAAARDELAEITSERCIHAPELVAEALRHAANALASITGDASSEVLLGEIFARFCIGK